MPASFRSEVDAYLRQRCPLTPLDDLPEISLHRPTPSSGLQRWLAEMGVGDVPPYWAYPWAGGMVLALYLKDHPETVAGRTVLDFGAGSGLVAIAAARAGARLVRAFEPDPIGRVAAALNAEANRVSIEIVDSPQAAEIVLAGDVFYDPAVARATLPRLEELAEAGCRVLIGDPYRRDLPRDRLQHLKDYLVPDMGGGPAVPAGVLELRA